METQSLPSIKRFRCRCFKHFRAADPPPRTVSQKQILKFMPASLTISRWRIVFRGIEPRQRGPLHERPNATYLRHKNAIEAQIRRLQASHHRLEDMVERRDGKLEVQIGTLVSITYSITPDSLQFSNLAVMLWYFRRLLPNMTIVINELFDLWTCCS